MSSSVRARVDAPAAGASPPPRAPPGADAAPPLAPAAGPQLDWGVTHLRAQEPEKHEPGRGAALLALCLRVWADRARRAYSPDEARARAAVWGWLSSLSPLGLTRAAAVVDRPWVDVATRLARRDAAKREAGAYVPALSRDGGGEQPHDAGAAGAPARAASE